MTRDKGHYRGPQFSYQNPPPSKEAAQKRLDELGTLIERIKTDLDQVKPDDYYNDADYADWKWRVELPRFGGRVRTAVDRWPREALFRPCSPRPRTHAEA